MEKQKDDLLQQIIDNSKESTVYLEIEIDNNDNIELKAKYPNTITATGFYVEPDRIITTIGVLANVENVNVFSANQYETIRNHATSRLSKKNMDIFPLKQHKNVQINDTENIIIEGVTAYDGKYNLVLLKVTNTGIPLSIGNSDSIQIDDPVYITGYHKRMGYQGRMGHIQGRFSDSTHFEVNAEFITGGYGGPAMNKNNEVIGVASSGLDANIEDLSTMTTLLVSSNAINTLIANSGNVIPLTQWKKYAHVRAYSMESKGDHYADFEYNREALNAYNSAQKLNPYLCGIHPKIGRMKVKIGNLVGALWEYDKALAENPYDIFTYNNRSNTKSLLGDLQGALDDVNKALEINPDYVIGNLNRAQYKKMLADFQSKRGNIDEARKNYQEAMDDLNKLLRKNPRLTFARNSLKSIKRRIEKLNLD